MHNGNLSDERTKRPMLSCENNGTNKIHWSPKRTSILAKSGSNISIVFFFASLHFAIHVGRSVLFKRQWAQGEIPHEGFAQEISLNHCHSRVPLKGIWILSHILRSDSRRFIPYCRHALLRSLNESTIVNMVLAIAIECWLHMCAIEWPDILTFTLINNFTSQSTSSVSQYS